MAEEGVQKGELRRFFVVGMVLLGGRKLMKVILAL